MKKEIQLFFRSGVSPVRPAPPVYSMKKIQTKTSAKKKKKNSNKNLCKKKKHLWRC
jgi:hypothetical protein